MATDNSVLIASVSDPRRQVMSEMPNARTNGREEILGGPSGKGAASCSLKRKRPPKIEIPNVLLDIYEDIFTERTAQRLLDDAMCFGESGVGVFSLKGKKRFMEDAHKISSSSNGSKGFFGVYDGHGGSKAAEFVAENLHLNIFAMTENSSENITKEEAIKEGYLKTDEEFLKQGLSSGVCCVTAVIEGREMVVSNLGDCRAVVCRDGVAEALTTDHKPAREDERRRIEDKGGYVEICGGTLRVDGTLAVSRSIGDAHLKDWVMAEPESKVVHLTPDTEYLVLASDGLWKEVSNQEAVDIVIQSCSSSKKHLMQSPAKTTYTRTRHGPLSKSPRLPLLKSKRIFQPTGEDKQCYEKGSPASKSPRVSLVKMVEKSNYGSGLLAACKELVDLAVARGSLDDITVMIVDLSYYCKGMNHCEE